MAQRGVRVSAAAASLGHDPAIFLRTYEHLYPGELRAVADGMDLARADAITEDGANRSLPSELAGPRGNAGSNRDAEVQTRKSPLTRNFGGGDGT
jgi:hypothetical protein